ncbi:MAG: M28 family peptidase [Flavobacteriales bacterium]|nr:M28 family peptidase [Flavobacteriales bacterium]
MNKVFGSIILIFLCQLCSAQDIKYSRFIIDTLTSEYFAGRGVVDSGEAKAAQFISNEFKRIGLEPFGKSYNQSFSYAINTFPGKLSISIDGKPITPGVDFLVAPNSCKIHGDYKLIWYNESNIPTVKQLKKLANEHFFESRFVVIDNIGATTKTKEFEMLKINSVGAAGIIRLEEKKLTHRLSLTVTDYVTLHILRSSINSNSKNIFLDIDQHFEKNYTSQNIIGKIVGKTNPDSIIVFSAHYDHLGKMGVETYFPGANDNASGIAMLLSLANYYSLNKPKKTIVFMAFGAEESGIIGSKYYTENPLFPLNQINFLLNLDLMGTGEDGIQVVNGSVFSNHFLKLNDINQSQQLLKEIKTRGKAANSDHYWFTENGVPSFFIYTLGGVAAYHDIYDKSITLPLNEFEDCFKLLVLFVGEL